MAVPSVALKALGVGVVAVPTVGLGVVYRKKIGNFFSSSSKSNSVEKSEVLKESLLKKLKNSGIKFEIANDDGLETINNPKEITFSTKTELENKEWTWECKIKLTHANNQGIAWDSTQKDIFTKQNTGFIQKLKSPGNDHESIKERFVEKCSSLPNPDTSVAETFKLEKSFNLVNSSNAWKITTDDFNEWFEDKSLTQNEKTALDTGNLTFSGDDSGNNLKVVSPTATNKPADCIIMVSGDNKMGVQNSLNQKVNPSDNTAVTEDNKRHRRALFKKCKNNNNQITPYTNKDEEIDVPSLFDFSDEINSDGALKTGTWAVEIDSSKTSNSTMLIKVTKSGGSETAQTVCKVVGFKENIDSGKLSTSQEEIKTSLEGKINPSTGQETPRENFLNRCRRTWDNTIKLELIENSGKYSLKDLNDIFG